MTPDEMKQELEILLEETTTALGSTDQTYVHLLHMLNKASKLSIPSRLYQGQLVFFKYKPQSKQYVNGNKYYDKYPLVMVTETRKGGFYGLNLHFLQPNLRRFLFEAIVDDLPTIKATEEWRTRVKINYDRLVARRQFRFFEPCYRQYNWKSMRRRPVVIPFEIWEEMVMSNTGRIERAKPITVYRESYNQVIRKG